LARSLSLLGIAWSSRAAIRSRWPTWGPYFLTQKLLPMLADGGAIANTTSNSAIPTGLTEGYSAYASMRAFDRFPEVIPPIVERTALGRLGEADDIGKVIAALLSDECGWITGENIEVSGGFNL
jgi:NAD(P)-dependent dehydrogenase (short-subunit alcohol dehydrogenase family)